jgi:hypothetical protein
MPDLFNLNGNVKLDILGLKHLFLTLSPEYQNLLITQEVGRPGPIRIFVSAYTRVTSNPVPCAVNMKQIKENTCP